MDVGVLTKEDATFDGILGFLMLFANLSIFVFIQVHRSARREKEYILLGLLAFFNCILGVLLIYKAYYYHTPSIMMTQVSRAYCFSIPQTTLIPATAVALSLILPLMALDRYCFHISFTYYSDFARDKICKIALHSPSPIEKYALQNLAGRYGPPVTAHCHPFELYSQHTILFQIVSVCLGHLFSVVVYLLVVVNLRRRKKEMAEKSQKRDLIVSSSIVTLDRRHQSVVRTFVIFAVATIVLMVLPTGLLAIFE
ncbi:hypothetical protein PFISCL1PPCAC_14310, partial [Pristionchus fissidentatus]